MKNIVNLSGGKDSTAMLLMMLDRGMPVDYIVFADTGKDFPQMLDHLDMLAVYIKEHYPAAPEITILKAEKTFDYFMYDYVKTKGAGIGQRGYGWATMRMRWCTGELKEKVIAKFLKSLDEKYTQYIGIAVDEPKRVKKQKNKRYPLVECNITEAAALQYCYERGFRWGGLYEHFDRVSCWCCPLQPLKSLRALWKYHSDLWVELRRMDARSCNQFKPNYSVAQLEERFAREEKQAAAQTSIFDIAEVRDVSR